MIVLGIDPGPNLCGWAILGMVANGRPQWADGGHCAIEELFDRYLNDDDPVVDDVDLVVVECPSSLHRVQANTSVIDTAFAAGHAHGLFATAGPDLMVVSPPQVRASMIGVAKRGNQDAAIKAVLEHLIVGAPKRWNNHLRDAAAAAIVGHRKFERMFARKV